MRPANVVALTTCIVAVSLAGFAPVANASGGAGVAAYCTDLDTGVTASRDVFTVILPGTTNRAIAAAVTVERDYLSRVEVARREAPTSGLAASADARDGDVRTLIAVETNIAHLRAARAPSGELAGRYAAFARAYRTYAANTADAVCIPFLSFTPLALNVGWEAVSLAQVAGAAKNPNDFVAVAVREVGPTMRGRIFDRAGATTWTFAPSPASAYRVCLTIPATQRMTRVSVAFGACA